MFQPVPEKWLISPRLIGKGTFGSVYIATRKQELGPRPYAVKVVACHQWNQIDRIKREAKVLLDLDHPNVIKVHESVIAGNRFFIFENLVCGGDLFSYISNGKTFRALAETEVIIIVYQILKALQYLHYEAKIIHRDLKLDNILLKVTPSHKLFTKTGTTEYMAPEILNGSSGYGHKCDIWSVGVITHFLLSAVSPFFSVDCRKIPKLVGDAQLDMEGCPWGSVSMSAKNFVQTLIERDCDVRPCTNQCFTILWIA
ncbi:kinase-like protein [Yamadazyma tenuis ATCC 10573]|uniref:Kinase-like protein n=1 Tax=Candida tenuis (strain ATCC 10573 / BCRC 21748 / CBS 615 / JCM 9827 / NBRC 10315 / NRRL Y-1498 / VKM Y-70) TaxID=590646 RepID=G3B188_CANTC|nr:kinase-like protein [Yamadazyma tenuis ATCC 10573]EGV64908.1 kinase-like protein [Yamadazyma tenuis ATCC 10573]